MLKKWIRKLVYGEKADSESYISWLKKQGVTIGKDVTIYSPMHTVIDTTCPWLLTIGDHVRITHGVVILTHDYSWSVLKQLPQHKGVILGAQSSVAIGNNVFIGMNTIVTRGVKIGDNVVIGAGSVVTKDCDSNSVYAGNPARKIMTIEEYLDKRLSMQFVEAREMVRVYHEKFGGYPDEGEQTPLFKAQMKTGANYDDTIAYMQNNEPMFKNYEDFLNECLGNEF